MKLAYCNLQGELLEDPLLAPVGASCGQLWELVEDDLIPAPPGTTLSALPARGAVGISPKGEAVELDAWAVGALLPAGYLRLFAPAGIPQDNSILPLFGYTAVCFQNGELKVAAIRVDQGTRWDPANFNLPELDSAIEGKLREFPHNRLVRHLARCAREYQCFTAQNIFYSRWEGGIPVSGRCNAACRGCISLQESGLCPSPQSRINFTPSLQEIVELSRSHLERGEDPIVSGGQGCEGDPLLEADLWAEAIAQIRKRTQKGTININTNGGNTAGLEKVVRAGLDSVRIGLVSVNPKLYKAYHRPSYPFSQVVESLQLAKEAGLLTSLNLLTYPGITDREGELAALIELVNSIGIQQVQLRNLNIDPILMEQHLPEVGGEAIGMKKFITELKRACPQLALGSWSRSKLNGGQEL